jgi:hypothetical protein
MRRPGLLLLLSALACGPTAGHRARQTLAPTSEPDSAQDPIVACVDAVLDASPIVEQVTTARRRDDHLRTRYVVLRNPPGPRTTSLLFTVVPSSGAPRELVVEYVWPGPWQGQNGMQPPPDPKVSEVEGETMADIGAGLLREVRAECAPTAPGQPACSRVAQGRGGRCVLGT